MSRPEHAEEKRGVLWEDCGPKGGECLVPELIILPQSQSVVKRMHREPLEECPQSFQTGLQVSSFCLYTMLEMS